MKPARILSRWTPFVFAGTLVCLNAAALQDATPHSLPKNATDPGGQAERLVRQLGSESYDQREAATAELLGLGLAAYYAVEAARDSEDAGVRARVRMILPLLQSAQDERAFLAAMEKTWPEALKQGRLAGPLMGAVLVAEPPANAAGSPKETASPVTDEEAPKRRCNVWETALSYLARQQSESGVWRALAHGAQTQADVEQTSWVLMAFLGSGYTEKVGLYKNTVTKGLAWLRSRQREDGAILNEGWHEVDGLTHAVAAMALCEAAGMARRRETVAAAQKAVVYSCTKHQTRIGDEVSGFGRRARSATPDLFTTTLHLMSLKDAKVAGLDVPREAFEGVLRFLDTLQEVVEAKTEYMEARYAYRLVPGGKLTPQATILGALCRQYLGWKREELAPTTAGAFKDWEAFSLGRSDSDAFLNYLAMLVAFQTQHEMYCLARVTFWPRIEMAQRSDAAEHGSWDPAGVWQDAGRLFSTACNVLCLQVSCRCPDEHFKLKKKPKRAWPSSRWIRDAQFLESL